MINTLSIEKGPLEALYWGESGTPEDWRTEQEIADIFGCTPGAVLTELERHRVTLRSDLDSMRWEIWKFLTEEWGLDPEYGGEIFTRPVDFKLPRDEAPLAFVIHAMRKDNTLALWIDVWELVELPGRSETRYVLERVEEALERNQYKKVERVEDDSHEIDW
jgi:hypothetical protein